MERAIYHQAKEVRVIATGKFHKWIAPDGLILLEGWARDGLTDDQIAHNMGISRATLYEWKKRFHDISDALKRGKEVVDILVENALLKRALGYENEETTTEVREENGKTTKYIRKTVRAIPPDTTAQIFWLKNRRPDRWRDKHEVTDTTALEKLDEILEATGEAIME